jgi:peptide/nickel transport system substrate-binding protein
MKRKPIWIILTCLVVISMILVSCTNSTSITIPTTTSSAPTNTIKTTTSTISQTTMSSTKPITTVSTAGNWWDKLGTPQYGGTITLRITTDVTGWDPYSLAGNLSLEHCYMESLFSPDWTLDPGVFNFKTYFTPNEYNKGTLASSFEMPDPNTFIVHLRQGIHWQNISPANGREFTADDVVFKFTREFVLVGGVSNPVNRSLYTAAFSKLTSVTASDKYTVVFKFNGANIEAIPEGMLGQSIVVFESPDVVKQYGDTLDWHHALGTGPFILTDYVSGASATLIKNPNYWGYDERYPKNQLPYVDGLKYLIIPDSATALAALRTGKIDAMDGLTLQNSIDLQKTTPQLLHLTVPFLSGVSLDPRNDVKPFNDIRVRKAIQMAIDLPTISNTFYGGTVDPSPLTGISNLLYPAWGWPYSQWPQSLKDEYAYNPTAAKQLLADAGYPNGFSTDVVAQSIADLDLLQIVLSYEKAINVNISVRVMDSPTWISYVQTGHKQDAMAYKNSGPLSTTFPPLDSAAQFNSTYANNWCIVNDPAYDALYAKVTAATSSLADIKEAVRAINERDAEQHYTISLLAPNFYAFYQPWFKGYSGQYNAISGGAGGVGILQYLFLSRFWVDSNLKKSMGY